MTELVPSGPPLPYKQLSRTWAKVEIFLGLAATGVGLGLGFYSLLSNPKPPMDWNGPAAGLLLFVFGAYLAMAGHRSHLYQSLNEQTNILLQHIQSMKEMTP